MDLCVSLLACCNKKNGNYVHGGKKCVILCDEIHLNKVLDFDDHFDVSKGLLIEEIMEDSSNWSITDVLAFGTLFRLKKRQFSLISNIESADIILLERHHSLSVDL